MARPRFSEMLFDRRRQLGLTLEQASRVLRLKPQVLSAFEEGDFLSIPKSGYAQGMLSSYARYLGLNTRVIVSQFTQDLSEFEDQYAAASQDGKPYDARPNTTNRIVVRTPRDYRGREGLLPTTGGYAGDMHDYATTSEARSRQTGKSVPTGASRHYGRFNAEALAHTDEAFLSQQSGRRSSFSTRPFSNMSNASLASYTDQRASVRERRSSGATQGQNASIRLGGTRQSSSYEQGNVYARDVSQGNYVDDLRLDDASPFDVASSSSGRRRSRNIAQVARPQVTRRASRSSRTTRAISPSRPQNILQAILQWLFADTKRIVVLVGALVVIFLSVLVIVSVSSCINNNLSNTKKVQISSAQTSTNKPSQETVSTSEADIEAKKAADKKAEQEQLDAQQKTVVDVSVAEGEVSWVEIVNDGKSQVAQQITGPWSASYEVTDSISIQVSNPSAVRVSKNSQPVKFDTKTAGIGSVSIKGTKPSEEEEKTGDEAKNSKDKKKDTQGEQKTTKTENTQVKSKEAKKSN